MSYLVVLIVDNVDHCLPLLEAWEKAGILGVTILDSTGLGRVRQAGLLDDFPLMPSLSEFLQNEETHHRTLFTVVETQEDVDKMARIVYDVIGDLDDPHTGFMFVVPVLQVYGFGRHRTERRLE